ncbi:MAG: hypothetical protein GC159_18390 [Phycisphaera sp.]|nr:hypothetical protein [Phycisphaera sp.]
MTQLASLHNGLNQLKRFRASVRVGSAAALFGTIVLSVLIAAFVLDVSTHMGRLERFIMLAVFVGTAVWSVRRHLLPALAVNEDKVELALMVERQQGLTSDLVAALQFADGTRAQFGSPDLRHAVVEYTDEVSSHLDYLEGFDRDELKKRGINLGIVAGIILLGVIIMPGHAFAFMNRFLLGGAHYPTATRIVEVVSPGDRSAYGQPIRFRIKADGVLPTSGSVELTALSTGLRTTIELTPDKADAKLYVGELARAMDDMTYTIHLGDAYTDARDLTLIPVPTVEVDMQIETPPYATQKFTARSYGRETRIALEGSKVTASVTSDKPLKSATFTIDEQAFAMKQSGDKWVLPNNTPLANVAATMRYEVQVVDEDDLSLERPISGVLQVRADQPPRVRAATVTRYVLPTASPSISFGAVDDYALGRIVVHKSVTRSSLSGGEGPDEREDELMDLAGKKYQYADRLNVNLTDLKLQKGDRVTLTFEAYDYRGANPGRPTKSEQLVFEVTDRAGVLAALRELDTQMDRKLDQIIKAQLGIGDTP